MGYLLKVVEGPNKGAEIALVDGVSVTLGKSDNCDIILADSTMPDEPLTLEASGNAVMMNGSPLEPFVVCTAGATSFAVGPDGAPWKELIWPRKEEAEEQPAAPAAQTSAPEAETPNEENPPSEDSKQKRGILVCVVAALGVILLLLLAWLLLPRLMRGGKEIVEIITPEQTLASIVKNYGLQLEETGDDTVKISGNLATRRERIAATSELYGVKPDAILDLSDDESFHTAAEDALFTLTEGALKVAVATNRCLTVTGVAQSPQWLKNVFDAINADLPKLRHLDVEGVAVAGIQSSPVAGVTAANSRQASAARNAVRMPSLPVACIITAPYPCLVMRSGARIMEGASIGDSTILKIEAESVTLTNMAGRVVWKP